MKARHAGLLVVLAAAGAPGCAGRMRVELAAADALDALAGELSTALAEYQADLEQADDGRESAVVAAFVVRARRDHADDAVMAAHTREFSAALARLRGDRRVAWERYGSARDNLAAAQEVARDLRGFAVAGLALDQEARAYLNRVLAAQQAARTADVSNASAAGPAETLVQTVSHD